MEAFLCHLMFYFSGETPDFANSDLWFSVIIH